MEKKLTLKMINEIKEKDKLACLFKLIYIKKTKLKAKNPHQFLGNISHMAGKGTGERSSKPLEVIQKQSGGQVKHSLIKVLGKQTLPYMIGGNKIIPTLQSIIWQYPSKLQIHLVFDSSIKILGLAYRKLFLNKVTDASDHSLQQYCLYLRRIGHKPVSISRRLFKYTVECPYNGTLPKRMRKLSMQLTFWDCSTVEQKSVIFCVKRKKRIVTESHSSILCSKIRLSSVSHSIYKYALCNIICKSKILETF